MQYQIWIDVTPRNIIFEVVHSRSSECGFVTSMESLVPFEEKYSYNSSDFGGPSLLLDAELFGNGKDACRFASKCRGRPGGYLFPDFEHISE